MISQNIVMAGDGHFHLYPCYDPAVAINSLVDNLNLMADVSRGQEQEKNIFKIAFLAESRQHDYFHKILENEISFKPAGLVVSAGPETHCISFNKQGKTELCLVAGRQIVAREKIEILGLGMEEIVPDGLHAEEIIEKVIAAGALPVLAFSPGKWLFKRADVVRGLAEKYGSKLIIGDSALRPYGWPEPEIMRRARGKILPGSDPLPISGEEKYSGRYGFIYQGLFDVSKPFTAMKEIISNKPEAIITSGKRCSVLNVAGRLIGLRRNKARIILPSAFCLLTL